MLRAVKRLAGGQIGHVLNRRNGRANVFHQLEYFAVNVDLPLQGRKMNSLKRSLHRQTVWLGDWLLNGACPCRIELRINNVSFSF